MSRNLHNLNISSNPNATANNLPPLHSLHLPHSNRPREPPIQTYQPTNPPYLAFPQPHHPTSNTTFPHPIPHSVHHPHTNSHFEPFRPSHPLPAPHQRLFSNDEAVNAFIANKVNRASSIPDIIPGYKGKGFLAAPPKRIDAAISRLDYIPYPAVIKGQNVPGLHSADDALVLSEGGNLIQKGLDAAGDDYISEHDWTRAAEIVEACMRILWDLTRSEALNSHHRIVRQMSGELGWDVARRYDKEVRKAYAIEKSIDISEWLGQYANKAILIQASKRAAALDWEAPPPTKRSCDSDAPFRDEEPPFRGWA
ncbi:hypothetical protein E1B28_004095 [Marasmius oreades]|uniref:Uncharacterized protein n=1 Tax=Marasmius oreades TaxID=181124 RepID=A0A9P7UXV9_9AGAR|nr:uncharacterized protein E1B28_004095 [Marasmius oreades]KAG7096681.1 hypothetical protein E1B28_004095 [Marasmius oreades]